MRILALLVVLLCFPTASFAEPPKAILDVGIGTGTGTIEVDGTEYDLDLSGNGFSGQFYISDDLIASFGKTDQKADITIGGQVFRLKGETTTYGLGFVFGGRLDYSAGEGTEHVVGISSTDTTVKIGSESSSSDSQALSYVYKNGLDDGLSLELGALIDTEDLMKDRTLSIRLVKSIADNIQISGLYQMSKSYEDANNGSDSKLMVFGLQYTF
jgi:hypothetical protein